MTGRFQPKGLFLHKRNQTIVPVFLTGEIELAIRNI